MKNKLTPEVWAGIGVLLILAVYVVVAIILQGRAASADHIPYSATSPESDGALALSLWLASSGRTVSTEVHNEFSIPPGTDIVLVLEPLRRPDDTTSWRTLTRWVERGGSLVVAGKGVGAAEIMRRFEFTLTFATTIAPTATLQTPLWQSPPLTAPVQMLTRAYLTTPRRDFVTYFSAGDRPLLVSFHHGQGRVILCSTAYPFSNQGLRAPENAAFVSNVLAELDRGGAIWIDEWRHQAAWIILAGPWDWLRHTAAGRALLYVGCVCYLALVVRGWPFGRPLPLARQMQRRAPLEYVTAIANLRRRAGHRDAELRYYYDCLKRALGGRYRLDPALPDREYVARLAACEPGLDDAALLRLLQQLRQPQVSESEMVRLAAEVARHLE